jgi:hypothetical protein
MDISKQLEEAKRKQVEVVNFVSMLKEAGMEFN